MAVKFYTPKKELNKVLKHWVRSTLSQLVKNTQTQYIFPVEVYPGYKKINAAKPDSDPWKSTGEGVKSFKGRVISGDDNNPWNIELEFEHRHYLKYVDLGVGRGTKLSQVQNGKKGDYNSRYISRWDRPAGQSQRPAIMMEMRHLQKKIEFYLQDYYGLEIPMRLLSETFTSDEINLIIAQWG